jgi:hypothetical protein
MEEKKEPRYLQHLRRSIAKGDGLRTLARAMKIPPGSLHSYLDPDLQTEPRVSALEKMAAYYHEPVSVLLSTDDDETVELVKAIHRLSHEQKKTLLAQLTPSGGPNLVHKKQKGLTAKP